MNDFMKWLYPNYIRPYLNQVPKEDYELWLSLMDGNLTTQTRQDYQKCMEFTAIHAFLLGLRTGEGLLTL